MFPRHSVAGWLRSPSAGRSGVRAAVRAHLTATAFGAAALLVAAGAAGPAAAASAPASDSRSTLLFGLHDPRLTEVSGAAVGIRSPDVLYVHNDSGDRARFFALDARTGEVRAQFTVPGAANVDWEDIAVARDARGVPSVWIADVGDNDATRSSVQIYRVDEPRVTAQTHGLRAVTTRAQTWRLRYPGGPRNAEGMAVFPGGAVYLVDKTVFGPTSVYAVPPRSGNSVQTVAEIGSVQTRDTGTSGGPNLFGRLTVTGAAASADGTVLALRTYTDAYLWRVGVGGGSTGVQQALRVQPRVVALPAQPQGEGIAVRDDRLILTSEKTGSGVYSVPLPVLPSIPNAPPASSPMPTASSAVPETSSAMPPGTSVGSTTATRQGDASASGAPTASGSASAGPGRLLVVVVGTLIVVFLGLLGVAGTRLVGRYRR